MQSESENKMVDGIQTKNKSDETKDVSVTAVGRTMNEYHFPGTPDFLPISVRASTIEQATEIWKAKRQPVAEKPNTNEQ
jgi:hypothetical protein